MLKKVLLSVITICAFSVPVFSQPPATDIFLFDLEIKNNNILIKNGKNITNRNGYDNQPSFSKDGMNLLFSSIRDNNQSDIYMYDLIEKDILQITNTIESEYSPTPISNNGFSTVRVEKDDSQRLWKFYKNKFSILIKEIKTVGYHHWIDNENIALFLVGEPHTLNIYNLKTKKLNFIANNVGRSIHKIPNEDAISYVSKLSNDLWEITEFNLKTNKSIKIIRTLKNSEDYTWLPSGDILMGKEKTLYKFNPLKDRFWLKVINLSDTGINNINRISVSSKLNKIAIVSN